MRYISPRTMNPATAVFPCQEKTRLLSEYFEAMLCYSGAVNDELQGVGVRAGDYLKLSRTADRARLSSEGVRRRLARHIAKDQC